MHGQVIAETEIMKRWVSNYWISENRGGIRLYKPKLKFSNDEPRSDLEICMNTLVLQ